MTDARVSPVVAEVREPARVEEYRHATCLRWLGRGLLLEGPSGSGKSDLALRLIEAGADLVADDLVLIERCGGRLRARAAALAGAIELRGQGIFAVAPTSQIWLDMQIVCAPTVAADRLPPVAYAHILGLELPSVTVATGSPSCIARLRIALLCQRSA